MSISISTSVSAEKYEYTRTSMMGTPALYSCSRVPAWVYVEYQGWVSEYDYTLFFCMSSCQSQGLYRPLKVKAK